MLPRCCTSQSLAHYHAAMHVSSHACVNPAHQACRCALPISCLICTLPLPAGCSCLSGIWLRRAGRSGIEDKLKDYAAKRNMKDETVGPVITWTTEAMLDHVQKLLQFPGEYVHQHGFPSSYLGS